MGEEIVREHFRASDFRRFEKRLAAETAELERWFAEGRFAEKDYVVGFELEAWLTDRDLAPAPINGAFLEAIGDPAVVPELAQFNVELNCPQRHLRDDALSALHEDLSALWQKCRSVAAGLDARLLMIGTHPLAEESALTLENMTGHHRYRALNEQVMRLRRGNPLALSIEGIEGLHIDHRDLTFESAATSFQIHLQVPEPRAARSFNAALAISGPMVAAAANSPYLFGKDLWDETRIPLFEQAVNLRPERVTFGRGLVNCSLFEIFEENLRDHPVLLPELMEDDMESMHHLRLHNGTIWRWNRPLIGFDEDGIPHLRIEHRAVPAGPSAADCIANTALCAGLMSDLASEEMPPELVLPFDTLRDNFYRAARSGLGARMKWMRGKTCTARDLLLEELVPRARRGLEGLGVTTKDIGTYLGIIEERVGSGQNGAAWQRKRFRRIGGDFGMLVADYYSNQERDAPVHTWEV